MWFPVEYPDIPWLAMVYLDIPQEIMWATQTKACMTTWLTVAKKYDHHSDDQTFRCRQKREGVRVVGVNPTRKLFKNAQAHWLYTRQACKY